MTTRETINDREKEREVLDLIGDTLPFDIDIASRFAHYDASFSYKGKAIFAVEIKTRSCSFRSWDTYKISAKKIENLKNLCVPTFLYVQWSDALGWIDVNETLFEIDNNWGRRDRGDESDVEKAYVYLIEDFDMVATDV